jgi:hypothetical protein
MGPFPRENKIVPFGPATSATGIPTTFSDELHRSTSRWDLIQFPGRKKAHPFAVGRPKRILGAFGSSQFTR